MNTRRHTIAWLLCIFLGYSLAFAKQASSSQSWWEGMDLEDSDLAGDKANSREPQESPLLQVPCGLIIGQGKEPPSKQQVYPLETILDSSLPTSTIVWSSIQSNLALSQLVVRDNNGNSYLPSGSLWLRMGSTEATIPAPAMRVVVDERKESGGFSLRLGMDFLRFNKAIIDLNEEELYVTLRDEQVMIPFLRPRPSFEEL